MVGTEAVVVSAVVSGVLKILGNKLALLVMKEYISIMGVKKDLQELHYLVEEINFWLETVGDKVIVSGYSFNWLKRLKDVCYDVDDLVDEVQLEAEKHDFGGRKHVASKYLCGKPTSFLFRCKAAHTIKRRFGAIVKQRTFFSAIANSLPVGHLVCHMNKTVGEMPLFPNVDASSVLARDQEKHQIISKLVETSGQQKIKIVSIIGLGGAGKTTLAKLVFNDCYIIEKHFGVRLWVHVSQEFEVTKLVEKLFEAISLEKSELYPLQQKSKTISDNLIGKRYLLVLDDVWVDDPMQWEQLMVHLKIGAPGSTILLTTRSRRIAEIVESTYLFDLPLLSEADSWQVFDQSFGMAAKDLDSEFLEVGKEIVNKCGGVPLAIKVIAVVLRDKKRIEEWQAIRHSNLLDVEGKEHRVAACLRLSYFNMPSHLKQCFTICSVFPKGHRIDKEQLIDQWIAHGLITSEHGFDYLEHIGVNYFNSLVQMYFLQDAAENSFGTVECRMHDLVHDLARSILGDEMSLVVPTKSSTRSYRYFCLIEESRNIPSENLLEKARAVYIATGDDFKFGKTFKNAKHLHSITVECTYTTLILTSILQIKNLRYISISGRNFESLPEAISDIWNLQALQVRCINLDRLPTSIGNLQKLRTLNLSFCHQLKCLPNSIGDCHMISNLVLSGCNRFEVLPDSFARNKRLRVLRLGGTKLKRLPSYIITMGNLECLNLHECHHLEELPSGIGNLKKLENLNLSMCTGLKTLPESIGDCHMISSMDLSGCKGFEVLPNSIGRNERLRVLRLGNTEIERLPSSITTLRNLEYLDLRWCRKLVELPDGIRNLEKLQILNLEECRKLRAMPVGIKQLSQLQKLSLFVVGVGVKSARIFELGNVNKIGGSLTISGIEHVMDPSDAHRACLKQKTNLQKLQLKWGRNDLDKLNIEMEQAVLDGLQPPPGIKNLYITQYAGGQYARWMAKQIGRRVQGLPQFPCLTTMTLSDFPNLRHLQGLVELPCLEELKLSDMPSLESISGGPFPSLKNLCMENMQSLGEVWMLVTETTLRDEEEEGCCSKCSHHFGKVQIGSHLSNLTIGDCPELKLKPCLPLSLGNLQLYGSNEQLLESPGQGQWSSLSSGFLPCISFDNLKVLKLWHVAASSPAPPAGFGSRRGWELLQHMTALESLDILCCVGLTMLPKSMQSLTSLQSLRIDGCSGIHMLPEWLGELWSLQEITIQSCDSLSSLPQSMGHLTSLMVLRIKQCSALHQLPECQWELCSLRKFEISRLPGLTCLPQSMCHLTALEELILHDCPGLTSLPVGIKGLTTLHTLKVLLCPNLKEDLQERKRGLAPHLAHP